MLKNYLKIIWRGIIKDKTTSAISIIGLTLGITCFLLTFIWVYYQYSFDSFHERADRIHRVINSVSDNTGTESLAVSPFLLGPELKAQIPEISQVTRIDRNDAVVLRGDNRFNEDDVLLVDQDFLSMFDFKFLSGSEATALRDPFSVVISTKMATKYFGDENPVGKTIRLYLYDPEGNGVDYTVTGLIETPPLNSHIQYTFLVSFSTLETAFPDILERQGWLLNNFFTYILTNEGASKTTLEEKIARIADNNVNVLLENVMSSFSLQPFSDIYLFSDFDEDFPRLGNYAYIFILISIGFFILLLAVVNYVNMSTAVIIDRIKSLVVRKVNGAKRSQLVTQILIETMVYMLISFLLAAFLIEVFTPFITPLIGEGPIETSFLVSMPYGLLVVLIIGVIAGFISGGFTSKIDVINGLKGQLILNKNSSYLRKILVVFQFSVTAVLLIGIFFVNDQLGFIENKSLGFSENEMVALKVNGSAEVMENYDAFQQSLLQNPGVINITRSNTLLANGLDRIDAEIEQRPQEFISTSVEELGVDFNYLSSYEIDLAAGRDFNPDIMSDSLNSVIINEAAVKAFGWENNLLALGKEVRFMDRTASIIGVVKDFHTNSLHHQIEPTFIYALDNAPSRITVKMNMSAPGEVITFLKGEWENHFPNSLFDFTFLDTQIENQYRFEARFANIFSLFSTLSLFIACIGLFGLANFSIKRRTKEIGIRKVLGASVAKILLMTVKEFLILVLIANIIAFPIIYLLIQNWLDLFAYKTDVGAINFIAAAFLILIISFSVVIYQTSKAALSNPINSLKSE